MNLKAKKFVEKHKQSAEARLSARRAFLTGKGLDEEAVRRDALFRKIGADIRKANRRLASIAAQEKLIAEKAAAKVAKAAQKKASGTPATEASPPAKPKKGQADKKKKGKKGAGAGAA